MTDATPETTKHSTVTSRRLLGVGAAVSFAALGFYSVAQLTDTQLPATAVMITTAVATILGVLSALLRQFELEDLINEKVTRVEQIESVPPEPESTTALLNRHIDVAIGHEEITMLRSERRANNLYTIGQFFLIASILGPILATIVYCVVDPLPSSTVQHLKELKAELGELPGETSISIQRDWRILLGGVTFGFLLLAAATGLLRQQAKELSVYFRVAERVNFYKRLVSVLQIQTRVMPSGDQEAVEERLADLVVNSLLDRAVGEGDPDNEKDDGAPTNILELAKAIKGIG